MLPKNLQTWRVLVILCSGIAWQTTVHSADAGPSLADSLQLTEVMYNSADGSANDFVEFHNAGTSAISLADVQFTEGITFTFPAGATLAPGGYLLVVRADAGGDYAAFRTLYGLASDVPIVGPYSGNLSDSGEKLVVVGPGGTPVLFDFAYSDARGWPAAADGVGHSIVLRAGVIEAGGSLDYAGSWRASTFVRGSPGRADPEPQQTLRLNEIVAHTDFLNEFDSNDWVEIYQAADVPFVFGPGWFLSDSDDNLRRWAIPSGRQIPARGFIVFDEVTGFNNPRGTGFSINKAGEVIYLSYFPPAGPGGVVDAVAFKGQQNDWSLARVPDGGAYWDQVAPRTRGVANAAIPPRVAISEILFHEGGIPTNNLPAESLEFLELFNGTGRIVQLSNTNAAWRLSGGIDFEFSSALKLQPDERLVVVSFDPTDAARLAGFRTTFGIPTTVQIVGPYAGRLDNDTDRISLEGAQEPDVPGDPISWVIIDEVLYGDRPPWAAGANGQGRSINRSNLRLPGNDPANWIVATPTPGSAPGAGDADADQDGMPDAWESEHGFDSSNPSDAAEDADSDGLTNLAEYQAGTDPRDPASGLRIVSVTKTGAGELEFSFAAAAGRGYVVESRASVNEGAWSTVQTFPAGSAQTLTVRISPGTAAAFHRVRLQ